jgi:hypothetical protein
MQKILHSIKKVISWRRNFYFGQGTVVEVEEVIMENRNPFFPIVMIPCDNVPDNEKFFRIVVVMDGKKHVVYHTHLISRGVFVGVKYRKGLFGNKIEAIELPRKRHTIH